MYQTRDSHLRVLTRDLDLVELAVFEVRQIVAEDFERLEAGPAIQVPLITISPSLQPLYVFCQGRFDFQEVLLIVLLK